MYTRNPDGDTVASNQEDDSPLAEVVFHGDAREVLRGFPDAVKEDIGYALYQLQLGQTPPDSKFAPGIGSGVFELREQDASTWYRVLYCRRDQVIHVLHAFTKQSNRIEKGDADLADRRFRQLLESEREDAKHAKRYRADDPRMR
jgi:phage-related protein